MMLVASLGQKHPAEITKVWRGDFKQFVAALLKKVPTTADKAAAGWVSGAEFKPEYRHGDNFVARHFLSLDYDHIKPEDVGRVLSMAGGTAFLAYTTHSNLPSDPRMRVWIPLSRPASAEEYQAVARKVAARADIGLAARESFSASQMMYRPCKKEGAEFKHWENTEAPYLDVDKVLGEYDDWKDTKAWPRRFDEEAIGGGSGESPLEKPGIVGAFCRAFTITAAIDRFELPYTHVGGDRWTYTRGSRPEGVIIYDDDTKLHSHHDTDPARGQHNAFDLVRLHRFGALDSSDPDRPLSERASQRAMSALAMEQPEFAGFGTVPEGEFGNLDADATSDQPPPKILFRSLAEIRANPTKVRWMPGLKYILECGVQAVMTGPRGSYKSFIALHWALMAAAAGASVAILTAEGAGFDRRVDAWLKEYHKDRPEDLRVFVYDRRIDLNSKEGREAVHEALAWQKIRPQLFLIDTYTKYNGALDENSNTEIKVFVGAMAKFAASGDMTILYVSHTGHTEQGRPRGGSALEADTDAAYVVKRLAAASFPAVRVSRERFKDSPEMPPLEYQSQKVDLGRSDDDGEPVTSVVMRPHEQPKVELVKPAEEGQADSFADAT